MIKVFRLHNLSLKSIGSMDSDLPLVSLSASRLKKLRWLSNSRNSAHNKKIVTPILALKSQNWKNSSSNKSVCITLFHNFIEIFSFFLLCSASTLYWFLIFIGSYYWIYYYRVIYSWNIKFNNIFTINQISIYFNALIVIFTKIICRS